MKAIQIHEHGGPEVLRIEDVPDPQPGPGQVRVRISAAGLNRVDVDIREGRSRFPIPFPHVPGLEAVGAIEALGEGLGDYWKRGDRVIVHTYGGSSIPGVNGQGGYAEKLVTDVSALVRIPDSLSDQAAGALQLAFGTAWHMLFTRGELKIGESVLISSVSSGIASAAVQLARAAGAFVIGTSSSPEKLAQAAQLGTDVGIDYSREDVPARVREVTDGGVDLVFEHVGGESFQRGLDSLREGGRLVTSGGHAGEVVPLDIIPFFRNQHEVRGSRGIARDELERVVALAARGVVEPVVAKTFPLEQAAEAMGSLEAQDFFGKILLLP
jgi:NADPH:quinone reductase-like Zn-dependent oxidoreductase